MHFYESTIIKSKDGLQVKSYTNEHPEGFVIAKPKYIPTTYIKSDKLPIRTLDGQEVNRFDYWIDNQELKNYIEKFKEAYPDYYYECDLYNTWFFGIPKKKIQEVPDGRKGVERILNLQENELDEYLTITQKFIQLLENSGVSYKDMGVTNSTILGTYTYGRSDIDLIIYGKQNYWDVIEFMKDAKHEMLRWKTLAEWKKYYSTYNAGLNFNEEQFIWQAERKYADGFFGETVFSIFGVSEPEETYAKWGTEKCTPMGEIILKADVLDNYHAAVRPGYYELENSKIIESPSRVDKNTKIDLVVTFARDFMLQAFKGERIAAKGLLEKVESLDGSRDDYYRVAVGYFDSYVSRIGEEFIKVDR